jgi:hypothetical protein
MTHALALIAGSLIGCIATWQFARLRIRAKVNQAKRSEKVLREGLELDATLIRIANSQAEYWRDRCREAELQPFEHALRLRQSEASDREALTRLKLDLVGDPLR